MSESKIRTYSKTTRTAMQLLGDLIRTARLEQRQTAQELAERAGISRGLLRRIEQGDLKCEIGVVFEVATLLGVPLFDEDPQRVVVHQGYVGEILKLMPKSVRKRRVDMKDNF